MIADDEIDVREIVGRALGTGSLSVPPLGRIGNAHRIAALAKAPRLGSSAWRFKFGHDVREYRELVWKLAKRASRELDIPLWKRRGGKKIEVHDKLLRACAQAVREWVINTCSRCGGSGMILKEGRLAVTCDRCLGDGSTGATSQSRAVALKMDVEVFTKVWEERLNDICRILRAVDGDTASAVERQLGMRRRRKRSA